MNIEEIRKNAPSWANSYRIDGNLIEYTYTPITYDLSMDGLRMNKSTIHQFNLAGTKPL